MYRRVCLGTVNTKGFLVNDSEVHKSITNYEEAAYISVFKYNEAQYEAFKTSGTVAGVEDVASNVLVWDFDDVDDLSGAASDTKILLGRLIEEQIAPENIRLYFSGRKGFTVSLGMNEEIDPRTMRSICVDYFGKELKTLDRRIYNASRVLRVPMTRHEVSGLYKVPLLHDMLNDVDGIRALAATPEAAPTLPTPHTEMLRPRWRPSPATKKVAATPMSVPTASPLLTQCRTYLQNGYFKEGQRNSAFLTLAATYKNLGYPKEVVSAMLSGVATLQAARNGCDVFPQEDLDRTIVNVVFSPTWKNGQGSCKEPHSFLADYCKDLGEHGCKHSADDVVFPTAIRSRFSEYASNFETNVIKTGIKDVDDNVILLASSVVGLVGQVGSGKTSVALQILNYASQKDVKCAFFSMDMGLPLVYADLIQRENGYSPQRIMDLTRSSDPDIIKTMDKVDQEYRNVAFCFKAGLDVAGMKAILQAAPEPAKLVVVDYLECVQGPFSDQNANVSMIMGGLKDLANELNTCVLLLLQTQKHATGDVSDPLMNLRCIKGASAIEQACSIIMTVWREGYSAETLNEDKYMSMAVVKNRLGALWKGDFRWDGPRGIISAMQAGDYAALKLLKEEKKKRRVDAQGGFF